MRRTRYSLEEQVGGLVDRERRHDRRPDRRVDEGIERYDVLRRSTPSIRASRATDEPTRHVA